MSTIPPNLVGPIVQSGAAQKQAARALEGEREQQSNAVVAGNKISEKAAGTVGETDNDSRVHADAEGSGGQGGSTGEEHTESKNDDNAESDAGIRRDDDGQLHVDLEA